MRQKIIAIALCAALAMVSLVGCGSQAGQGQSGQTGTSAAESGQTQNANASFGSWNADSSALNQLTAYVSAITDESSPDYISVEDRIAVFDFDGTLFGEKAPIYYEWMLTAYRILEDPDYKDKATDEQKTVANTIVTAGETGVIPEELERLEATTEAEVFEGMTDAEFRAYVRNYMDKTDAVGFSNLKLADSFYKPMKEIVAYLQENDIQVYVCSGTDRSSVREMAVAGLGIPSQRIIGTEVAFEVNGKGDDGLAYQYESGDRIVRTDELLLKVVKFNKAEIMWRELGKRPILSFGNSTGDFSMAAIVTTDNPYKSMAFMVVADDTVREHGNKEKAATFKASCEEKGWTCISMANDWATIYGENVTLK